MRKIPNVMDIHRLIAEVRRRPGLWNLHSAQYKDRNLNTRLWNQVARSMRIDVGACKRKWRNLRDSYRAEVRRCERRMKRDRLMGITNDKNNYKSKWFYFDELEFMRGFKRRSCSDKNYDSTNSTCNDYDDDYGEPDNDCSGSYDSNLQNNIEIKMEPNDDDLIDADSHNMSESCKRQEFVMDDDEMANEMNFEEFGNKTTQQEVKGQFRTKNSAENSEIKHLFFEETPDARPSSLTANNIHCKCKKRVEKHVHFQEDIGKNEKELITSTKQELANTHNLKHVGDSDFNFLISFLPHIKEMNTLQNLQFRAKMSEVILNILAPTMGARTTQAENSR